MATPRGNRDKALRATLFDSTVIREAQEATEFLANVLEASTEYSIIGKDIDGKILLWNEGARRMYGYTAEEVVGKANSNILHTPEDVALGKPREIMDAAMYDGKWEGVIGRVRKDGKRITARVVMTPRRDASGSPAGFLLISKDISNELRFAEEVSKAKLFDSAIVGTAQEAVDFITNILQASTEYSIIGMGLDGKILLWNEGARRLYGYEPEEVVGKASSESLHTPEDVAAGRPREIMAAALDDGKWEGTINRIRKNGKRFTARVVITPRRDESGRPAGFLLISKDVSDEIRLTEELRASQYYTRSLIESNIDALMTTDPLGIITDVNQQMEALTGSNRDELIGTPFKNYFTDPRRAEEGIREVLRESKVTNYELTAHSKEGHETVVSYNAATFYDRDGKLQGVFAAARDVTERKRFEQTMEEKNLELENANLAKDRFLAGMSHELRTPLNAIIGFTGTLLMGLPGPLNGDQDKQLRTIQASARHLLSLINNLLALAKVESGKVEPHVEAVDCQSLVQEVAKALRPQAEAKGLAFMVNTQEGACMVQADRQVLSQIIMNLADNAIKFTERGQVRLELGRRWDDGQMVTEISTVDTGIGIRLEDQAKLFEAFSTVDALAERRHEGPGLGLHLSQKLAMLLGGYITFRSTYGQGSTFTLAMPEK